MQVYKDGVLPYNFLQQHTLWSLDLLLHILGMKFLATVSVLAGAVATVLGQTIDIGIPTDGTVLFLGQNFTAQILRPVSLQL